MSSKNKTANLGLSQFTANDEPKWLTDYNNDMMKIDSKTTLNEFTDSNGAKNYIGLSIGTIAVSTGIHIFTNCIGTVTVSGDIAKIYAVNSPELTINGKTATNWENLAIDGFVKYETNTTVAIPEDTVVPLLPFALLPGDEISLCGKYNENTFNISKMYLMPFSESLLTYCSFDFYMGGATVSIDSSGFVHFGRMREVHRSGEPISTAGTIDKILVRRQV